MDTIAEALCFVAIVNRDLANHAGWPVFISKVRRGGPLAVAVGADAEFLAHAPVHLVSINIREISIVAVSGVFVGESGASSNRVAGFFAVDQDIVSRETSVIRVGGTSAWAAGWCVEETSWKALSIVAILVKFAGVTRLDIIGRAVEVAYAHILVTVRLVTVHDAVAEIEVQSRRTAFETAWLGSYIIHWRCPATSNNCKLLISLGEPICHQIVPAYLAGWAGC
jgi:hypothetical protein